MGTSNYTVLSSTALHRLTRLIKTTISDSDGNGIVTQNEFDSQSSKLAAVPAQWHIPYSFSYADFTKLTQYNPHRFKGIGIWDQQGLKILGKNEAWAWRIYERGLLAEEALRIEEIGGGQWDNGALADLKNLKTEWQQKRATLGKIDEKQKSEIRKELSAIGLNTHSLTEEDFRLVQAPKTLVTFYTNHNFSYHKNASLHDAFKTNPEFDCNTIALLSLALLKEESKGSIRVVNIYEHTTLEITLTDGQRFYFDVGRYLTPLSAYQKERGLIPSVPPWRILSTILQESGDYQLLDAKDIEEALKYYQQAIEVDPDGAAHYAMVGTILLIEKNDINKAMVYLEKAKALDPQNAFVYQQLAHAFYMRGDTNLAIRALEEAIALDPTKQASSYNVLGTILKSEGRKSLEVSITFYEQALKQVLEEEPINTKLYNNILLNLGEAYFLKAMEEKKSASIEKAIFYLGKACEVDSHDKLAHYKLGIAFYSRNKGNDLDQAIALFKKVELLGKTDPSHPPLYLVYHYLGVTCLAKKDRRSARIYLNMASQLNLSDPDIKAALQEL